MATSRVRVGPTTLLRTLRALAGIVVALVVIASPARVLATETITFDANGPSSPLPLQQEFYLEGVAAADAEYVHLVYVRHSFGAWGINGFGITNCQEVAAALATPVPGVLTKGASGRMDIEKLWERPKKPAEGEKPEPGKERRSRKRPATTTP